MSMSVLRSTEFHRQQRGGLASPSTVAYHSLTHSLTHSLGAVYFQPPIYAQLVGGWPDTFTTQHNHIVLLTGYGEESLSYFSLYKSLLTPPPRVPPLQLAASPPPFS